MSNRVDLLKFLPLDIWHSVRDYLYPVNVENVLNSGSALWKYIFKDETWLILVETHDQYLPYLIGHNLSAFRPYYSGDLCQYQDKFFTCLQNSWVYNKYRHEISFQPGLIINIHEIITGQEAAALPLE
ncbi:uncharacterized protein BDW43DRAFT_297648 [Aspergillus alliaceus]|uniref:uncharacterized protein n=1 Tax=Petromyces alliaceus TaxID=209559 RepID=UPI0012A651D2|nr:uncharacterized protein BDW43DRAFT_297648 [Aspergillus alliaceus]KAB8237281.1 hypothetical protein BDW43DRAFT_297648 [Aspergillus alliaceus]